MKNTTESIIPDEMLDHQKSLDQSSSSLEKLPQLTDWEYDALMEKHKTIGQKLAELNIDTLVEKARRCLTGPVHEYKSGPFLAPLTL